MKQTLFLLLAVMAFSYSQDVLTKSEIEDHLDDMLLSDEYSYEILSISKRVNDFFFVTLKPAYREFPNVVAFRYRNDEWERCFEAFTIGIHDSPSSYTDLHTKGVAIDMMINEEKTVDINSESTGKVIEAFSKRGVIIPYQNFFHTHMPGVRSSYIIDKTNYFSIADKLLDFRVKKYPKEQCIMFDLVEIEDIDFSYDQHYTITAQTANNQEWTITFDDVDEDNKYFVNKKIEAKSTIDQPKFLHRFKPDSFQEDLYGFRLGQYKSTIVTSLGEPAGTQWQTDSMRVDFYYIDKDSSTNFVVFYPPNSKEIYSIQISGDDDIWLSQNLKLSASSEDVLKVLGTPVSKKKVNYGGDSVDSWLFSPNYSVLMKDDKLISIRIWDLFEKPDLDKEFKKLDISFLTNLSEINSRNELSRFLSSSMEVAYCDKYVTWVSGIDIENRVDAAKVYQFVQDTVFGIASLSKLDSIPHTLELRMIKNYGLFPVFKFDRGNKFREIVLAWHQNRYKIWEITYYCDEIKKYVTKEKI